MGKSNLLKRGGIIINNAINPKNSTKLKKNNKKSTHQKENKAIGKKSITMKNLEKCNMLINT